MMDQSSKTKKPNMADMRTEELQDDYDKLVLLKSMWQKQVAEVKIKLKKAGEAKFNGRPIPFREYEALQREKVELSTSIDRAQIDMGRIGRELKSREMEEMTRKSNQAVGMTERLFMQIAKEKLPEELYNEIFLDVKMKMLDL